MNRTHFILGGIITLIVTAMLGLFALGNQEEPVKARASAGELTGPAPWPENTGNLKERIAAAGLTFSAMEGDVLHTHQHLDIFIEGQKTTVPANIGVSQIAGGMTELHTHSADGILHVEAPKNQRYTLGQFMTAWGVKFTSDQIGGYKNDGEKRLRVYSNGQLVEGDPREVALEQKQKLVITYGTEAQLPNPVPATYEFPKNL